MQVANTVNNNIRILFNPRVEDFKLFDFLMVKSDEFKYIAQIIEIYDDKFDASQNVAKLKLFYQINQNNEVIPYDNFTPNKECEISKLKQDEIEKFINQDKETFILGTNVKTTSTLNVQYDFFNNAVVLADKVENANCLTFNLAKNLSQKKNVVIIDSTGVLEYEGAKKIKAGKNFKMPLNYSTLDNVFEKCTTDASLEFQATGGAIINEIKKFARKQEDKFIPFNLFTRVLIQQHKATPYPELKLLLVRLKKYQMDEIFARTKAEKDSLFKTIEKNPITIIDLSDVDPYWQKAYLEYIISDVEQEMYLITRVNDEHFDANLINKIYNKKTNIKFVPNVSYNYKKLPTLMQYCKNYILMPSLLQRSDFLDANFALSNLISQGCIVFGENTDNFLYLAKDYELEIQEKRKNYRKIALTLVSEEEELEQNLGQRGDYFENRENQISDSEKLIKELSEFESTQQESIKQQEETFEEIENPHIEEEKEDLIFNEEIKEETKEEVEVKSQAQDDFQEITEETFEKETKEEPQEEVFEEEIVEDNTEEKIEESFENIIQETSEEIIEENQEEIHNEYGTFEATSDESDIPVLDVTQNTDEKPQINEIRQQEACEIDTIDVLSQDENADLSDEELDFFQMAQESENEYEEENQEEPKEKTEEEIDLNEIAHTSIDSNFDKIINSRNIQNTNTIALDEETKIDADILNKPTEKENLPIFKEEIKEDVESVQFAIGNVINHKKYGKGTVVKTIKYEERQLLQVEFETAGKKLLDPKVADIKLEQ